MQLGGLQERISEIEKLNSEVIAISTAGNHQDVEVTKGSLGISYILISIPNRQVVEDFGLRYNVFAAAYATFIIDKKGRIRFKSVDKVNDLTWPSKIIRELQGM
jgi:peroxiredoxin